MNDKEHSAQVNVRFDGDSSSIKFGLLGRWRDRDVNVDERELRVGPKVALSSWTTSSPEHRHGNMGNGMDSAAMRAFWAASGSQYSARPQDVGGNAMTSLEEDYVASEDIFASYAMGTWDGRAAHHRRRARGEHPLQGDRQPGGRGRQRPQLHRHPRVANSSYTNVLPGLHLR